MAGKRRMFYPGFPTCIGHTGTNLYDIILSIDKSQISAIMYLYFLAISQDRTTTNKSVAFCFFKEYKKRIIYRKINRVGPIKVLPFLLKASEPDQRLKKRTEQEKKMTTSLPLKAAALSLALTACASPAFANDEPSAQKAAPVTPSAESIPSKGTGWPGALCTVLLLPVFFAVARSLRPPYIPHPPEVETRQLHKEKGSVPDASTPQDPLLS